MVSILITLRFPSFMIELLPSIADLPASFSEMASSLDPKASLWASDVDFYLNGCYCYY